MGSAEVPPADLAAMEFVWLSKPDQRAVREYWDRVIEECHADVAPAPRPTSALLDGSAAERRRRRIERRQAAAVVRELPLRREASGPDGREVA